MWMLALACVDKPPSVDSGPDTAPVFIDEDGDGLLAEDDCDDTDPLVGGAELPYDGIDNDCDPSTPDNDLDGDGVLHPLDCDDANPNTHPGAAEVCDGVDQDCDSRVDEQAGDLVWVDADGDGFGDAATRTQSCEPGELVTNDQDCDDTNPDVHPDATEVCNGIDDDCDSHEDNDAVDRMVWYADDDGDGYGAAVLLACSQPAGSVSHDGDCDDADPGVRPGAPEICNGTDDDCDGDIDPDDSVDAQTWYIDNDKDGFGDPARTTQACLAPSKFVSDDTDCDDSDEKTHPGATEVCDDGHDDDCDGLVDCEDGGCATDSSCLETACSDGDDNDSDGLVDCQDDDCLAECVDEFVVDAGHYRYQRAWGIWSGSNVTRFTASSVTGQLVLQSTTCSFTLDRFTLLATTSGLSSGVSLSMSSGCPVQSSGWLPTKHAFNSTAVRSGSQTWLKGTITYTTTWRSGGYGSNVVRGTLLPSYTFQY